ncbi:hypothetical protein PVT67_01210 [Gallaecimonas kandeliae]|uniref:hypothetical protein n=1 Tax=Gallaecimonas kandeliae TaxID=3029055 RepID=UPI0026492B9F|nr:hypothetical protein [Gallaecimonas kandeliae]WKE65908.1 hypothetical protein PVT67_01210 [Gallaecimonas kandeliae]
MQEIKLEKLQDIQGGSFCEGTTRLAGALIGGAIGGYFSGGFAAATGVGIGEQIGAWAGDMVCSK